MFTIETDGAKYDAEVSFDTAVIYEAEFKGDLIVDLYGNVREDSGEFSFEPVTTTDADGNPTTTMQMVGIDFTKVPWTAVMKALWAAVKTATPVTPGYAVWSKTVSGVNLWELRDTLMAEVSDCFFRTATAEETEEEDGR